MASNFYAQQLSVEAVIDTSKMRIGEQAKIDIYVTYSSHDKDIKIQWPALGDTITNKIEIISISPIDTTFPDKTNSSKIFQHQQILVSVYDSGYYAVPGFKFIINNDTTNPIYTNPLFLEVHTVPTDTSATKLKDIKAPFNEKFNWKWYINYIYFGAALLILLIIVVVITAHYARKNKQVSLEPEKPKIPAHFIALAALEKIKMEQVWREGKVKEYYSSISETIRNYIEDRFNLHALESTTDEIMTAFRSQVIDKESKEKLQQLLTLSDLVKFAKMFPIEEEHNFTLQNAFDFVNGTKRDEEMPVLDSIDETAIPSEADVNTLTVSADLKSPELNRYIPGAEMPFTAAEKPKTKSVYNSDAEQEMAADRRLEGKKRFKRVTLILVAILIVGITVKLVFFSTPKNTNEIVTQAAEINKICPIMMDQETRLDQAVVISDEAIQFNFTLVNVIGSEIDVNAIKTALEPAILDQVKTNPQMEKLRASKATFKFSYNDKTANFLFSIKVTPEDYGTFN